MKGLKGWVFCLDSGEIKEREIEEERFHIEPTNDANELQFPWVSKGASQTKMFKLA